MSRSLRLSLLLAAACGPTLPETTSATGSTGATGETTGTTAMSEGTGSTGDPTTGPVTTTGVTTTTGEPATTTTTATTTGETTIDETTGGPTCEDADPQPVKAQWTITFPDGKPQPPITSACDVVAVDEVGQSVVVSLSCELDFVHPVELTYTREPAGPPPVQAGELVWLAYREEPIFWINRWFSITSTNKPNLTRFAGISADHIEPPGASLEEFYAVPLAVLDGVCEPLDDGPCGPTERLALEVPFGDPTSVFDGQFEQIVDPPGHYDLWLETARRPVEPIRCDDVPPAWFQALMFIDHGQ